MNGFHIIDFIDRFNESEPQHEFLVAYFIYGTDQDGREQGQGKQRSDDDHDVLDDKLRRRKAERGRQDPVNRKAYADESEDDSEYTTGNSRLG